MKKTLWISAMLIFSICISADAAERRAQVEMKTTKGDIVIELYNETPIHRDNFLNKVKSCFYDSLLFHRVIRNFMIQGGDPTSKKAQKGEELGSGEAGDWLPSEFRIPTIYHKRGAVAMARESDAVNPKRKSSACQFYIVWGIEQSDSSLARAQRRIDKATNGTIKIDTMMAETYKTVGGTPYLDGQYTVFGDVVKGLDVVEAIQNVSTDEKDRPIEDIRILSATIIQYPDVGKNE
jgi:cyclophilin family peptidyl-prolyl cis-trans isomerase